MGLFVRVLKFLLILGSTELIAKEKTSHEVLFVSFDTAETLVWKELMQNNPELSERSSVICMATGAKLASEGTFTFLKAEQIVILNDLLPQRLKSLSQNTIHKLSDLSPYCVVTGMYSTSQAEIAALYASKGVSVVAFWDNPSSYEYLPKDLVANVEKIINVATFVLCPTQEIASDLNMRFGRKNAKVVGHPTIDSQVAEILAKNTKEIEKKLPWTKDKSLVMYVGGYEENGNRYEDSLRIFLDGIKGLGSKYDLLLQLHPRSDGLFESKIIEQMQNEHPNFPRCYISSLARGLSSSDGVAIADLVIANRSTVGFQAFVAGKVIAYVDVPETRYSNVFIDKGLAPQFTTSDKFNEYMKDLSMQPSQIEKVSPIPSGGKERMLSIIQSISHPSAEE